MNDLPQRLNVTVTLQVDMMGMPDVDLDRAAHLLAVDRWCDGRYPFSAEMLREGLVRELRMALTDAVEEKLMEKYGNEMVGDEHSSRARWAVETDNIVRPMYVAAVDHIREARIEVAE